MRYVAEVKDKLGLAQQLQQRLAKVLFLSLWQIFSSAVYQSNSNRWRLNLNLMIKRMNKMVLLW